jgi:hypothetical protein
MLRRVLVALIIGQVAAWLGFQVQQGAGDLSWPLCGARAIFAGRDPYTCPRTTPDGHVWPTNPLTTALTVAPLALFPDAVAGALFIGLSAALLTFGLTREGQWWRLLALASPMFVYSVIVIQWAPLLMAVALYPVLLPLTLAKPQTGLPVALTRLTPRRALACALFGLVSLVIDPTWPLRWLPQTRTFDGFIPMLLLPFGPLMLLALWRWRDPSAQLLLLLALMPQRTWYDQLLLWLIPHSWRGMLVLTVTSWAGVLAWLAVGLVGDHQALVACVYLPALVLVLTRRVSTNTTNFSAWRLLTYYIGRRR